MSTTERLCPHCGTLMYPYMGDYGCPEPTCPINNYLPFEDSDICPDCLGSGEKGVVVDGCANVDVCDTCFGQKRILKQKQK